ncbi:MAG: RagB/SusD family nutrient uptake outer membrane protein [Proteobacteria bacterium]|nr:RagB/SusD family nutrient uptake outer membrane protein [Pseudomonadota bacterium]
MTRQTSKCMLIAMLFALPACYDEVPNLNGLDLDELEENPTPSLINEAAIGLLIGHRANKAATNGYVATVGILGRESYNLDPADPRFRSELLETELDPGSPAFGGNFWNEPYRNIRNAYTVLNALDVVIGMSDGQKNAVRGFTKTIMALDFLIVINTRDENGIPIDVDRDLSDELAPIVTKEQAFDEIERLLDEGCRELGGCADPLPTAPFPFDLGSGFYDRDDPEKFGFNTPEHFVQFNRAIATRALLLRPEGDGTAVLDRAQAALDLSFIRQDANELNLGVYHVFSTGSGDTTNGLNSNNLYVHPSTFTGARTKADGKPDDRVTRKLVHFLALGEKKGGSIASGNLTYSSDYRFAQYRSPTASVPIIRNEELLLMQAEIYIRTGQFEQARTFLNFIRQNSGGLDPLAADALTEANAVDELLYERRYSLLLEGGHRWVDMRRFNRLDDLLSDDENPGLKVFNAFPIPVDEANARK